MGKCSVTVVGAGLAGSEAAWQLAQAGVPVTLVEMRPSVSTPVHKTGDCAELVCSNSFRSHDSERSAIGVLHHELLTAGSLIIGSALDSRVPAGSALAVDRYRFSARVTEKLAEHPLIERQNRQITSLNELEGGLAIVATGPLTSLSLAKHLVTITGQSALGFYDGIAPVVYHHSLDLTKLWRQSRWDKGEDYLNAAFDQTGYQAFVSALIEADAIAFKPWESVDAVAQSLGLPAKLGYFEGCLPIEELAARGANTLRFGPMKPVGLTDPQTGRRPYAVVQLRQDNQAGTLWNLVGFQTKIRHRQQASILRMIPGLESAEFARLGGVHRNLFLQSPTILDQQLRLRGRENLRFAGQMIGVEGYVESAATGLLTAMFTLSQYHDVDPLSPPANTAHGALWRHVTTPPPAKQSFKPMNVNFGLFPDCQGTKRDRAGMAQTAKTSFAQWWQATAALRQLPRCARRSVAPVDPLR